MDTSVWSTGGFSYQLISGGSEGQPAPPSGSPRDPITEDGYEMVDEEELWIDEDLPPLIPAEEAPTPVAPQGPSAPGPPELRTIVVETPVPSPSGRSEEPGVRVLDDP